MTWSGRDHHLLQLFRFLVVNKEINRLSKLWYRKKLILQKGLHISSDINGGMTSTKILRDELINMVKRAVVVTSELPSESDYFDDPR